jgi:hypothetical protein
MMVVFFAGCGGQADNSVDDERSEYLDLTGPYLGQEPPGLEAKLFGPGLISTGLHDDGSPVFSPDGREVWFRKWALPHDIVGYCRMVEDGRWTRPELFKEFGKYLVLSPRFIPGGNRAFFNSRRPFSGEGDVIDMNIWYADKTADGWSELRPVEGGINTDGMEGVNSVSLDGTIYLQASYEDSMGGFDIYVSRSEDGKYGRGVNLGAPVNSEASESAPVIAHDGSYLVFGANRPDMIGTYDLYVSFTMEDGSWSEPVNLGPGVNSEGMEKFAGLSPDGKYLFFLSDRSRERSFIWTDMSYDELIRLNQGPGSGLGVDVYWISTGVIENLRPE